MNEYELGDVVNVYFPYQEDPKETKHRPAIIIEDLDDECVLVKCTKTDVSLHKKPCVIIEKGSPEYKEMGLTDRTFISVEEEVVLKKYHIHSYRGACPAHIMNQIDDLRN